MRCTRLLSRLVLLHDIAPIPVHSPVLVNECLSSLFKTNSQGFKANEITPGPKVINLLNLKVKNKL